MFLNILAWIVICIQIGGIILIPSKFGKDMGEYNYKFWFISLISAGLIIPLALRVLGYL